MSTNINITVGDNALLDAAKANQAANRQAQLDRESSKKLATEATDARTNANAAAGKDANGNPLYGVPTAKPDIDRRPAANRQEAQGLNLGHLWIFRDAFQSSFSTGIREISGSFGRSRTGTNLRGEKQDVLLGCGDGSQWLTFAGVGTDTAPSLPEETFTVEYITPPPSLPASNNFERQHIGPRLSGRSVNSSWQDFYFALPCGNSKFIFVYGYSSVWDTFESNAYYAARALYNKDTGAFIGFFDPATGDYTSNTIPNDLTGNYYGGNAGVIDIQGYTGKSRKFVAYICDNKSIREIQIPVLVQSLIDAVFPEPTATTKTITYRVVVNFTYDYFSLSPVNNSLTDGTGYTNNYYGSVYTPAIFALINSVIEFVNPSTIKTFPEKLKWGLADTSEGAYFELLPEVEFPFWSDMYRGGLPFYHALWPNKNEEPDPAIFYTYDWQGPKPKRITKSTLNLSPSRTPRLGAADRLTTIPGAYWYEDFVTVWDWDDPSYCRSMCKALGFSDADLTP